MRNLVRSPAIVLRKRELPQKDVVVTLFTREFGKVIALAKGARTLSSKRAAHLQTANLLEVHLELSVERAFLRQTTLISAFGILKEQYVKLPFVYTYLFVLDRLLPERQQECSVYAGCISYLTRITKLSAGFGGHTEKYLDCLLKELGYHREPHSDLAGYIEELIDAKLPLHDII